MTRPIDTAVAEVRRARERGDVDYLVRVLQQGDLVTRGVAARSLGLLGDARAVQPLLKCLAARDESLRITTLKALARIADPGTGEVIARFAGPSEPFGVKSTAIEAMANIGDRNAVHLLADILITKDFTEHYIQPSQLPMVSERPAKRWASKKLVEFNGVEAIPKLELAIVTASLPDRVRLKRLIRAIKRTAR